MTTDTAPILLRAHQVCEFLQISRSTLDRLRARGVFPQPVALSAGTIRWRKDAIENYLTEGDRQL